MDTIKELKQRIKELEKKRPFVEEIVLPPVLGKIFEMMSNKFEISK